MHTSEQRQGVTLWTSRPFALITTFCGLSLLATQLPSPWWDGALLDISVRWPAELERLGLISPETAPASTQAPAPLTPTEEAPELPELEAPSESAQQQAAKRALADALLAAHLASKRAQGPGDGELHRQNQELLSKLGPALAGVSKPKVRIERPCLSKDASGKCKLRALDTFFEELRLSILKKRVEPVRISQYGDSLISGDGFTGELRRLLQDQFGDGGHGFVPLQAPSRFMGFDGLKVSSNEAWRLDSIASSSSKKDRLLGVGGVAFEPQGSPMLKIEARDKGRTFERLGLMATPKAAATAIELKLKTQDGATNVTIPAAELGDAIHWISLSPASSSIELSEFKGAATYYGVLVERSGAGVVVDNFGMLSSRAASLVRMDSKRWKGQLKTRGVNLASFSFGTNSAAPGKPSTKWLERYKQVYKHVLLSAQGIDADRDCMVLGILTRASRSAAGIEQLPSVQPLVGAQRETALESGCAFWDMNAAMGGDQGPKQWYNHSPRLLGSDFTHPTRAGYKELAKLFYGSMMYEFKLYLEHGPGGDQ